jgi:predicted nuclease of predicted toxin-antitoxin system
VKILADEGVDYPIVERLRQRGHWVWYVAEMEPGIYEDVVLDLANREGAVLLTADKDFGELVFRQGADNERSYPCAVGWHFPSLQGGDRGLCLGRAR